MHDDNYGFVTMEVVEADDANIFVAGFLRPLRPEPQTEEERSSNPEDEGSNPSGASILIDYDEAERRLGQLFLSLLAQGRVHGS